MNFNTCKQTAPKTESSLLKVWNIEAKAWSGTFIWNLFAEPCLEPLKLHVEPELKSKSERLNLELLSGIFQNFVCNLYL